MKLTASNCHEISLLINNKLYRNSQCFNFKISHLLPLSIAGILLFYPSCVASSDPNNCTYIALRRQSVRESRAANEGRLQVINNSGRNLHICGRQTQNTSITDTLLNNPIILSFSFILAFLYLTIHNHQPRRARKYFEESKESEESKELGLLSKKIGIAREVLALTAESFNVAAHDLELINFLFELRKEGSATENPGKINHQGTNKIF